MSNGTTHPNAVCMASNLPCGDLSDALLERDALRARVAGLERENVILTTQRDEYRECCSALDCHGTKGVTDGWVCVPECEWEQAFRPLNLF